MDKKSLLHQRHQIIREIRRFFDSQSFLEVQTPLLVCNPGLEPHLLPFETLFEPSMGAGSARNLYLPTSPEYHLKKALSWGLPRIFEITKSFRNGEQSQQHEPEFLMLEWYRAPGNYRDIAQDFEALLKALSVHSKDPQRWREAQHLTVQDAFQKWAGVDLDAAMKSSAQDLAVQGRHAGCLSLQGHESFDEAFEILLVDRVERSLKSEGLVFLWDYPSSQAALSRRIEGRPLWCERFEVYFEGIELANAFGELTDSIEQRSRCVADQEKRRRLYPDRRVPPLDEEFLDALTRLPPAGGIAVGLDRCIQCLLDLPTLQAAIAFTHRNSV
jgi:lysyl-tRNA synthetase class 2